MTEPKFRFFSSDFTVSYKGEKATYKGLISEGGITKTTGFKTLPDFLRKSFGKPVQVELGPIHLKALIVEQYIENGYFVDFQFIELNDPQRDYLKQRIALNGVSHGWDRKYPRIPVHLLNDPDLPVINLAVVHHASQDIFVSVLNFTLGGIRIQTFGDDLKDLKVGSLIHIDLIKNNGDIINGFSAEVRNFTVQERATELDNSILRSFGLKISHNNRDYLKRYKAIIKEFCELTLQKFKGSEEEEE